MKNLQFNSLVWGSLMLTPNKMTSIRSFFLAFTEPTLKALLTELHPVRDSWYNIGLQLDIPHITLNCFQQNYTKHMNLMREVLIYWLETAVDPRWITIVIALRSSLVNENHLADQLESKYCAPVQLMREKLNSHTGVKEREGIVITTLFCNFGFSLQFSGPILTKLIL